MAPTAMHNRFEEYQCAMVQFGVVPGWIGHNGITYAGPTEADFLVNDDLYNRTVMKALNNLKDQKVNLSQAFAERQQTVNLVASSAKRMAQAINDLKKLDYRKAASRFGLTGKGKGKTIAELWLELQYGWKPLLSDIYGSAEQLAKSDADSKRYVVTAKASNREKDIVVYPINPHGIHYTGLLKRELGCYVRLDAYIDDPLLGTAAACGLTNPAQLAWEELPWSFVADWFAPIGTYLSTWDAPLGYAFRGGSVSTRRVNSFSGGLEREGWGLGGSFPYWYGVGASFFKKEVIRTPYGGFPVATFPGFKNPLSLTHMANALALLRQAVS